MRAKGSLLLEGKEPACQLRDQLRLVCVDAAVARAGVVDDVGNSGAGGVFKAFHRGGPHEVVEELTLLRAVIEAGRLQQQSYPACVTGVLAGGSACEGRGLARTVVLYEQRTVKSATGGCAAVSSSKCVMQSTLRYNIVGGSTSAPRPCLAWPVLPRCCDSQVRATRLRSHWRPVRAAPLQMSILKYIILLRPSLPLAPCCVCQSCPCCTHDEFPPAEEQRGAPLPPKKQKQKRLQAAGSKREHQQPSDSASASESSCVRNINFTLTFISWALKYELHQRRLPDLVARWPFWPGRERDQLNLFSIYRLRRAVEETNTARC